MNKKKDWYLDVCPIGKQCVKHNANLQTDCYECWVKTAQELKEKYDCLIRLSLDLQEELMECDNDG